MNLRNEIDRILLPDVHLPGQYIGGELGSIAKPPHSVRGRLCFAFPDVYTIGMSHYGLQLLYSIVNARADWACERVFAPYLDIENVLRKHHLPLYSLENFSPLSEFDVLGFTLQYELTYTNVLTILDLGGIPLHGHERNLNDPLVIAGGPSAVNPEPLADFIDLFVIGDGEVALLEVCDLWLEMKQKFSDRRAALLEMARRLPYAVVPRFYEVFWDKNGRAGKPRPIETGVPEVIHPTLVSDINDFRPPRKRIVPLIECIQDRVSIEIMRGCPGLCQFCVSTVQKRPIRIRKPESVAQIALDACLATGAEEVSLLSLSTSDYPHFEELMEMLRKKLEGLNVAISVPSLRINHLLSRVMRTLTTERTSGLTLAPEVARDDTRKRIGKPMTNENLLAGCEAAFRNGFNRVKLYFLCGLPDETQADLDGIVDLSREIFNLGKSVRKRPPVIVTNVSNLVPKPHTPWERFGMKSEDYFRSAHHRLIEKTRKTGISLKYHTLQTSLLEALLCRGDRRLGRVIETAWRQGARLDAWTDYFRGDLWQDAISQSGINAQQIIHETIPDDSELPWGHVRFS